jgi:hypothetical protein
MSWQKLTANIKMATVALHAFGRAADAAGSEAEVAADALELARREAAAFGEAAEAVEDEAARIEEAIAAARAAWQRFLAAGDMQSAATALLEMNALVEAAGGGLPEAPAFGSGNMRTLTVRGRGAGGAPAALTVGGSAGRAGTPAAAPAAPQTLRERMAAARAGRYGGGGAYRGSGNRDARALFAGEDSGVNADIGNFSLSDDFYRNLVKQYASARDAKSRANIEWAWNWARGSWMYGDIDALARRGFV